jgi:hypothetical protein
MATLAKGNEAQVYVPLASTVTVTPGAGGYVDFGCSSPMGSTAPAGRRVYAAENIDVPSGSTVFMRAEVADASYIETSYVTPAYVGAWANRPAPGSVPLGTPIHITDIPAGGRTVFYAGATLWYPQGGEVVLGSSGIALAAVTGTLSSTSQTLMTIPGGLLGPNGSLVVEAHWTVTNNANTKNLQLSSSDGNCRVFSAAATNNGQVTCRATMTNRANETQQIVQENTFAGTGSGPGTPHIGGLNTTVDWTLRSLTTLTNIGDSSTLERWAVVARPF